jgi:hypothetical protein
MVWNLFEKIIDAVKSQKQSQPPANESQPWSENDTQQPEGARQSSAPQQTEEPVNPAQKDDWHDNQQDDRQD